MAGVDTQVIAGPSYATNSNNTCLFAPASIYSSTPPDTLALYCHQWMPERRWKFAPACQWVDEVLTVSNALSIMNKPRGVECSSGQK